MSSLLFSVDITSQLYEVLQKQTHFLLLLCQSESIQLAKKKQYFIVKHRKHNVFLTEIRANCDCPLKMIYWRLISFLYCIINTVKSSHSDV